MERERRGTPDIRRKKTKLLLVPRWLRVFQALGIMVGGSRASVPVQLGQFLNFSPASPVEMRQQATLYPKLQRGMLS
jgi:hypothetical protein